MQLAAFSFLLAVTTSLAHYTGYGTKNLILREEPQLEVEGNLVECPVCEPYSLLSRQEECNIVKGNKKYKMCPLGTYVNEVCGDRLDCYRGPGQQCTEKMDYDAYGQKCAHGYYCDSKFHVCTGVGYTINSHLRWLVNDLYRPMPAKIGHSPTKDQPDITSLLLA